MTENLLRLEDNIFNDFLSTHSTENFRILTNSSTKNYCPQLKDNKNLSGHLGQGVLLIDDLTEEEIQASNPDITAGGRWKPTHCQTRNKVNFYQIR